MPRVLVVYATTHGHTGRIARRVAERLQEAGFSAELHELRPHEDGPAIGERDAVVVGASVHAGRHQKHVVAWARAHAAELSRRPNALFSVSLTAADDTDEARAATRTLVDELIEQTAWRPDQVATFAGALQYREYDLATRVLMKLIARRHHAPTDASHDHDFTDWEAVDRFADEVGERVRAAAVPSPGAAG